MWITAESVDEVKGYVALWGSAQIKSQGTGELLATWWN